MSVEKYNQFVQDFIEILKSDLELVAKVYNGLNKVGKDYFEDKYHNYDLETSDEDDNEQLEEMSDQLITFNKQSFIEEHKENGRDLEEQENTVAFDDSYRHSAIIDIRDISNPIVENPCNSDIFKDASKNIKYFDDYCFTWLAVNEFATKFLENGKILVHFDGLEHFYFPLPN